VRRSPLRLALLLLAATLVTLLSALPAAAHPVGLSRGVYRADAQGLALELTLAEPELALVAASHGVDPVAVVVDRIAVSARGQRCSGTLVRSTRLERDGVRLEARYTCAAPGARQVDWNQLLAELAPGHRHEAQLSDTNASTLVFSATPTLAVAAADSRPASAQPLRSALSELAGFMHLGVEHIVTGYDHLVFLVGLVIIGLGTRRTLMVVTAFTVAHSLTIAVSVTGVWSPSPRWVEPAIALSVAYVGVENLLSIGQARRALLAFAFGLVHGFGFAGALADASYAGDDLWPRLAGFNLGVEAGQLAVLVLLLPLVSALRKHATVERYASATVNLAVVALGVTWFVLRV
jgi:hydrogenase/urease accessory protein HupE